MDALLGDCADTGSARLAKALSKITTFFSMCSYLGLTT